jgi:hypothetical protein
VPLILAEPKFSSSLDVNLLPENSPKFYLWLLVVSPRPAYCDLVHKHKDIIATLFQTEDIISAFLYDNIRREEVAAVAST